MGRVFLVEHPRLPRREALKLLNEGISGSEEFKARFLREADILAQLSHPNIVSVYDRGEFNGQLWIAMELIDGTDAGNLLRSRGYLASDLVIDLVEGAGSALDHVWSKHSVTHRDIKPSNILVALDESGDELRVECVKLVDFGIAKAAGESTSLTSTGTISGTMSYISPEAIEGRVVDNRSDIYALACTAFHLLSGRPPYTADSLTSLLAAHLSRSVPAITKIAPALPKSVDDVFKKALAKEPNERYQNCMEFASALRVANGDSTRGLAYQQTEMAHTSRKSRVLPNPRIPGYRKMAILIALFAALGLALAIVVGVSLQKRDSPGIDAISASRTLPSPVLGRIGDSTSKSAVSEGSVEPSIQSRKLADAEMAQTAAQTRTSSEMRSSKRTPYLIECLDGTPGPARWRIEPRGVVDFGSACVDDQRVVVNVS